MEFNRVEVNSDFPEFNPDWTVDDFQQNGAEDVRLLYVAATRAKEQVQLPLWAYPFFRLEESAGIHVSETLCEVAPEYSYKPTPNSGGQALPSYVWGWDDVIEAGIQPGDPDAYKRVSALIREKQVENERQSSGLSTESQISFWLVLSLFLGLGVLAVWLLL